jgi:hypothetical protein
MSTPQEHFEAARQWQEFLQKEVGDDVGFQVPAPTLGQTSTDYQRENLRLLKKTYLPHHELNSVDMRSLPTDALPAMWNTVIPAVRKEAVNPATVKEGEFREIKVVDQTGRKISGFIGPVHFAKFMGRPGRKVASFRIPGEGAIDASGRFLR